MKFICYYNCNTTIHDNYQDAIKEFNCANCPKEHREYWKETDGDTCLGFPTPCTGPFGVDADIADAVYKQMKKELLH